ncbi:MAG: DNRLRE domain-containing protein [Candidatus Limnocylindria bacterium]
MRRAGVGLAVAALMFLMNPSAGHAAALGISSAYLTAATRTYGAPVTCTLTAVADSSVDQLLATTNFGTSGVLNVSPSAASVERVFVRFDLTACSPAMPADALVQSAQLRLTTASPVLATVTIEMRSVSASWTEAGVTWNTQPAVAGSVTSSAGVTLGQAAGTVISWTATSDVQSFVTGATTNFGFRLSDSAEGAVGGVILSFSSREAASGQPQLVVTYVA